MDIEAVREYCLSKKANVECMPFDDTSIVMKVMTKIYILINIDGQNNISVKCDPEYAIELRERYTGINGAFHFNKKYWNSIQLDLDVNDSLVKQLIDHSYDEVVRKFTKIVRAAYDHLPV